MPPTTRTGPTDPSTPQAREEVKTNACSGSCDACTSAIPISEEIPSALKATKSIPAMGVSILVAFFPKCPICWAAYMSMFGSFGLARVPYQSWLYPVLLSFLGVHLYFIFRKARVRGFGPFLVSLAGAATLIGVRLLSIENEAILYFGMLCILGGSLWNSFDFPLRATKILTQ